MTVVLPFCQKDVGLSKELLEWIKDLGGCPKHTLWLVMDSAIQWTDAVEIMNLAHLSFGPVRCYSTKFPVTGWPEGPNSMFFTTLSRMEGTEFLWMEPDAIPIRPDWLDAIEAEYRSCGKPFMGHIYECDQAGLPSQLMSGVAVYPRDGWQRLKHLASCPRAFDVEIASLSVKDGHNAKTIHHFWGWKNPDNAPTFVESRIATDPGHYFTLERIRDGAALFHRNKDGTLVKLLRKKLNLKGKEIDLESVEQLNLEKLTLWACIWTADRVIVDRMLRVFHYSTMLARFGEVVLFSALDPMLGKSTPWKVYRIPPMSHSQYNLFLNNEVPKYIRTPYAMAVHEDGFIIHPELWSDEFLAYDYIGAPWMDGVVGNGGFCIESQAMLKAKLKIPRNQPPIQNADLWICRTNRKQIEGMGIRFAPTELAQRFSSELTGQNQDTFGFHGRKYNSRRYIEGWKNIENSET